MVVDLLCVMKKIKGPETLKIRGKSGDRPFERVRENQGTDPSKE
jgi:hypothetical protein